ncbi:MAG: HWE histidine kinase domain-containing protein [Pseudomonadota bacterium]
MTLGDPNSRGALLQRAIDGSDITVFYQDVELRYQWVENPLKGWSADLILGRGDDDIMPPEMARKTIAAKRHALNTRRTNRITVDGSFDGVTRSFNLWIDPDLDEAGNPRGLLCTAVEITDLRRREANLKNLLLEVSHRSRNLLAIVQSIARQTVSNAQTTDDFMKRFGERVQSIAHSLDVVTRQEWDGATVHDLLRRQLKPFLSNQSQLNITGDNPVLDVNAALHVGLAVQELGSNAAKHGAWSTSKGTVFIHIEAMEPPGKSDDGPLGAHFGDMGYRVVWKEDNIADGMDAENMRFGGHTLRSVVPQAVNGAATLQSEKEYLIYTLELPAENFRP